MKEKQKDFIISENKIKGYALDEQKSNGKSRGFEAALGYNQSNWQQLYDEINAKKGVSELQYHNTNEYGVTFRSDIEIKGANGKYGVVRTGWIKKFGSNPYELTTIWVL